jgi:ATP-dependent Clp protease ATP-binding subunit ClpA
MGALIAGAKYKGNLKNDKSVVKEVTAANGDIVLFIDEIHTCRASVGRRCYGCGKYFKTSIGT